MRAMAKHFLLLASATSALGFALLAGCTAHEVLVVDDTDGGSVFGGTSGSSGKSTNTSSSSSSSGHTSSSSSSSSSSTSSGGTSGISSSSGGIDAGGSSSGGTCPTTDPITASDIESQLAWQPPPAPVNVCTQANIDALKNIINNPPAAGVQFSDVKTALGTTCSACVFTSSTAAHWSVFAEDAAGDYNNETGSCFAQVENATCGKARFEWETCLTAACGDCATESEFDTCVQTAQSGACSSLTTTYANACPNEATDLTKCGNLYQAIAMTCSGGAANTINTNP